MRGFAASGWRDSALVTGAASKTAQCLVDVRCLSLDILGHRGISCSGQIGKAPAAATASSQSGHVLADTGAR